jgi:hypothetical protein
LDVDGARILIYDIENTPSIGFTWGKYDQTVIQFTQEWYMLCFAYKFLGDDEVQVVALPDFKKEYRADRTNDYRVIKRLHELYSEADIVIAHNGNRFDQRKTNARLLVHGFDPPTPYKQIDTCLVARKYFNFNSNKLGDLGEILGLGTKADTHGFGTWVGCMAGDKQAWSVMKEYNARDVDLLEQVYLKLRPWMDGHPNVGLLSGQLDACPKCGSSAMTRQGFKRNRTTTVQQWKCGDCGGWSSSRLSERDVAKPSLVN